MNVSFNILIPNSDIKARGATCNCGMHNSRAISDFSGLCRDNIKFYKFFKVALGFTKTLAILI